MRALFVHGMGRTPISAWPLLWKLKRGGLSPESFAYFTPVESFASIERRLISRITALAAQGDYVVIGHSLGGVLLRSALKSLPSGLRRPRHIFLLASPIYPSRLAQRLSSNILYKAITGDCGQFLASGSRMEEIGSASDPITAIVGVRGFSLKCAPFHGEPNDGVVAVSEVSAEWLRDQERIDEMHTLIPASRRVGEIILRKLFQHAP
ncbi:alpha/beta fold hydrolase [Massilia sp. W12]|uniref:esterase/lipase family protein n=1 Tax=Massilia sp. W12 TaxID=3126507 RepID=UPI0030D48F0D